MESKAEQVVNHIDSKVEQFQNSIWGIALHSLCTLVTMFVAIYGLIINFEKHNPTKIGICCFLLAIVILGIFRIAGKTNRLLKKHP